VDSRLRANDIELYESTRVIPAQAGIHSDTGKKSQEIIDYCTSPFLKFTEKVADMVFSFGASFSASSALI
jgi:hypothetical protein